MSSYFTKLGYFLFGVGIVNLSSYTTLKNYQDKNKAELEKIFEQHQNELTIKNLDVQPLNLQASVL
ncbi:UNKNOWN [Stylonychia lemnae]|uniref:Uncharacterized protein n=1 Tax=Stylonychia lemnae TaxID=5949 RepID=A0A078AQT6_STYLE|nr:UNKNOWN [Stylonychia lemnae]|eukprot:CDW83602.1 UNKNOWN [Stylonychia lemnae]